MFAETKILAMVVLSLNVRPRTQPNHEKGMPRDQTWQRIQRKDSRIGMSNNYTTDEIRDYYVDAKS